MFLVGDYAPDEHEVVLDYPQAEEITVINLEGPLLGPAKPRPAPKAGPHLSSSSTPKVRPGSICTLANNHFMDFGEAGAVEAISRLEASGLRYVGYGANRHEAVAPLVFQDGALSVGVLACTEEQFGSASATGPGVATVGPWIFESIRGLSERVDAVIVSVHGGQEDQFWPSPSRQDLYRSFIDAGARVVHGHHSHVAQGIESYGNGLISYGAGNFAVPPERWRSYVGGLQSIGLEIEGLSPERWRVRPLVLLQRGRSIVVSELPNDLDDLWQEFLGYLNRPLYDRILLEGLWQQTAMTLFDDFVEPMMGWNFSGLLRTMRSRIRQSRLVPSRFARESNQHIRERFHIVSCESHRSVVREVTGLRSGVYPELVTAESVALYSRTRELCGTLHGEVLRRLEYA